MRKYTVAVDIDGVVWDLLTPWLEEYNKISGDNVKPEDVKSYDISDYIKGNHSELLHYVLKLENFWDKVDLYNGVVEAVTRLQDNPSVDLVFVTATDYDIARRKFDRFLKLLPMVNKEQIIISKRKNLINTDFVVDDYEENLKHMVHSFKNGVPILISQSYNRSFPNDLYGIVRKESLRDATALILEVIDKIEQEGDDHEKRYS